MRRAVGQFLGLTLAVAVAATIFGCRSDQNALYDALERQQSPIPEAVALEIRRDGSYSTETVNYFSLADFDETVFALHDSDEPLSIIDYGPIDELPVEIKRPTIYVLFNQPMVPLSRLGDPMTESPLMTVEPELDGLYRWYGSRILAFEPSEPLMSQRLFDVRVSPETTSLGGKELGEEFVWQFRSEYLAMASMYPGEPIEPGYIDPSDTPIEAARKITVSFTYPVNLEHIEGYLRVKAAGREYGFSARRPENDGTLNEVFVSRTVVLDVEESFPEDTDVTVTLAAGAASEPEYLGSDEPQERSFHTLRPFGYQGYSTYSWSYPRSEQGDANPVYLNFSHALDGEEIEQYFTVSLPDDDLADNISVWGRTVGINNLPVQYDSSYRVTISPELTDVHGRRLGTEQVVDVYVPNARSYYYFPNTGARMLESQFPAKIVWEYQNIFDGVWKADAISDPFLSFDAEELSAYDFSQAPENTKVYETFDLSPWLNESGKGWVGLSWNFSQTNSRGERNQWAQRDLQVQVTDLGVTTRHAFNKVLVWVHSLTDGSPAVGAEVTLTQYGSQLGSGLSATTDEAGLASFDFDPGQYRDFFSVNWSDYIQIGVKYGNDKVEFRPNQTHSPYRFGIYNTSSPTTIENSRMETFLFTDRGLYKPGETVTFRGIDRSWSAGEYSVYTGPYTLVAKEFTYQAVPFVELQGRTSSSGGFYGSFQVPEDLAPGTYAIEYERQGSRTSISFQIAYFRRVAFQVQLQAPDRPFFTGDQISVPLSATYLAGGALGGGTYNYYWARIPESYVPPGTEWSRYDFGPDEWGNRRSLSSGSSVLSPVGEASLSQEISSDGVVGKPYRYQVEARVQDIDRQEVASSASVLVHPASVYLGAKLEDSSEGYWSTFLPAGEEATAEYVVVRHDGRRAEPQEFDSVAVELIKHSWKLTQQQGVYGRVNSRYERVSEVVTSDELEDTAATGTWSFTPEEAGRYTLRITALDAAGRTAATDLAFYATGSQWVRWGSDNSDEITLVPDKEIYFVGDTARILIQSPLPEGSYLITSEREGIFDERVIELTGSANVIEVPITEEHVPVLYVAVSSATPRTAAPTGYFEPDLGKPQGYFGITTLPISTETRTLDVEITPSAPTYLPGRDAEVTVRVTRDGQPVRNAEVTFLAVDRGVLDLIDYHVPNPLEFFYAPHKFPLGVRGADSRSLLIDPVLYEVKNLQGGDAEGSKLEERSDFRPLAVFEPFLATDADGEVTASFTLPGTLTTYRATAVVVNRDRFGIAEQEIVVQNPLNVRTVLPRRLRLRDTSRAGIVITNLSGDGVDVTLSLQTDGITIEGTSEREVLVEAQSSREVAFPVVATREGESELVFTIRSDLLSERLVDSLVVERPLVTEAFTVTGRTDRDSTDGETLADLDRRGRAFAEEGLIIPSAIAPDYGGLTVTLNSSRLGSIEEAVRYLVGYPHHYLDHQLTRILPQILFGEAIGHFSDGSSLYREGAVREFFESIESYQLDDGGFSYNPRYYFYSSPYITVRVAHYYALAQARGYDLSETIDMGSLRDYLRSVQGMNVSTYLRLYALYVQTLYNENVVSRLDSFAERGDELGMTGYGFLGNSYANMGADQEAAQVLARMRQFTRPSTRGIDLTETYEARYYFDSQVTSLAMLLLLQLEVDPEPELVERMAWQLESMQRYGYWVNTNDTAWAVTAYEKLIEDESGEETDMRVAVRVTDTELFDEQFEGFATDPVVREFGFSDGPFSEFERNELFPLRIEKDGRGVAYYTASVRYALPSEIVLARDEGYSLFAQIEDLDGNVVEDRSLELGETYRMRVFASTSRARTMVALRVPVPSGVDILDASFVTTGSYGESGSVDQRSWTRETTYGESQTYSAEGSVAFSPFGVRWDYYRPVKEIYDNEVRYYFDFMYPGRQVVAFLFRTTTPGVYPTPPPHIEGMYEPQAFGRGPGVLYVIEE